MVTLRGKTDVMIHQDKPARAADVLQSAPGISLAYQDALVAVTDQLENAMKLVSPAIDELMAIKKPAWSARLHGGGMTIWTEGAVAASRPWQTAEFVGDGEDRGRMG